MDELEIALFKDKILSYLNNYPESYISFEKLLKDTKLTGTPHRVQNRSLKEMQDVLTIIHYSGIPTLQITKEGEKLIANGGYAKAIQERKQLEIDKQSERLKMQLEIKNLRWGWWFSIAAILISVAALLISIFKE